MNVTLDAVPLPTRSAQSSALPRGDEAPIAENALLILDKCARICFCNAAAARIFGQRPDDLLSANVSTLIPKLPLRPNTPGYNLAYAAFQSANSRPRRFRARHAEGHEFAVDVSIKTMTLQGQHGFIVEFRAPQTQESPALENGKVMTSAPTISMHKS